MYKHSVLCKTMSYVDVFGNYLSKSNQSVRGPPGPGYKHTIDGQYDIDKKRLCNIADPIQNTDATSLNSVHKIVENRDLKVQANLDRTHNALALVIQNQERKISKNISAFESVQKLVDSMTNRLNESEKLIVGMGTKIHTLNLKINAIIFELKKFKSISKSSILFAAANEPVYE